MISGLDFMIAPLIASLLLILITSYFGIHVIEREIIFIDIALAQIAALGSAVSLVLHNLGIGSQNDIHDHDSRTFLAYIFCLFAAGIFTILKNRKIKIPLEAIIGIAYAVATTAAVIILDKGAGSDVHIHDMLIGAILWVSWPQIIRLLIIVTVTLLYQGKKSDISNPRLWDFLFYFTFGIVIVEAVSIGGILTVFAFLIIPASTSALFTSRWTKRISIGLIIGSISTVSGLYLSWVMDIPCSPAIILFLGVSLLLSILMKAFLKTKTN
jgi:zinc/manganese transport system permease protein